MAVVERERPRINFKKIAARGVAGVLFASGVGLTTLGIYDNVANTQSETVRFFSDMNKRFPVLSGQTLKNSQDNVVLFEAKSKELIKNGQANQVPQLVSEIGVVDDYSKIDQQKINDSIRQKLYTESGIPSRGYLDVISVMSGLILIISSIRRLMPERFNRSKS